MVGASKRKHVAQELLLLCLNNDNIHCNTTPSLIEALITGAITSKKPMEPSQFSPFGLATSFAGTHLQDINITVLMRRVSESKQLSEKDEDALYKSTFIICTTATQLSKNLVIFRAVAKAYIGTHSLVTLFVSDWQDFVKDIENRLADLTRTQASKLPAKMQCFVATTFNN